MTAAQLLTGIDDLLVAILTSLGAESRVEKADDAVDIVDRAAPGTAAHVLQRGPEPRIIGQIGIRRKVGAGPGISEPLASGVFLQFDRHHSASGRLPLLALRGRYG